MLLIRHGQSQFNVAFAATRVDPGIRDPELTAEGRRQAVAAAAELALMCSQGREIRRMISSPYTRALQTATILAEALGIAEVTVDPLVRERAAFHCDVGASPALLKQRFPAYRFDHLDDPWWHDHMAHGIEESEEALDRRAAAFRAAMARDPDWPHVVVVTHWGFIRAMTGGYRSANCEIVPISLAAVRNTASP
jgi:broad specificity phosphatase PhoE